MKINKQLWIGIGIGAAAGIGTGYYVGQKTSQKKHREEVRKARRKAYIEGVEAGKDKEQIDIAYRNGLEAGMDEAKKFIDTYCVVPDEGDTPEQIQEKLRKKQEEIDAAEKAEKAEKTENAAAEEVRQEIAETEAKMNAEPVPPIKIGTAEYDTENHVVVFRGAAGTKFVYPAGLFVGPDGELLDSIDIRNNIRKHEHNKARLNLIWSQMGWGTYIPDLDGEIGEGHEPTDEEINNWDLSLDEDDGRMLGDEPEEKTRERERYLDEVDRYLAHPEDAPRIISRKEFDDECYLEKVYFDYYDVDNKFIENTDVDNEIGPYDYFGITDGNELFRMKNGLDDEDPDIVHVKNFRLNCVMEVTRYHRSYGSVKDGGAYIGDGSTDSDGRADGM